jgi:deoxyadenosine/deoxycytidine kinase
MDGSRVFVIDGVIGAGKSTLIELLTARLRARGLRVCPIMEPVDSWAEILPVFYADPVRFGYSFQTFVFATRVCAIRDAVLKNGPEPTIFLLERSPSTDRVFMGIQNLLPVEKHMYETWADMFELILPLNLRDATPVYLAPSLETCMARVAVRARNGEAGIPADYQHRLHRAHMAMYGDPECCAEFPELHRARFTQPVRIIPAALANTDYRENGDALDEILGIMGL